MAWPAAVFGIGEGFLGFGGGLASITDGIASVGLYP